MKKINYFKLFACCITVKGHARSALYDLQRNSFEYIPNILFDLLEDCKNLSQADLQVKYLADEWQGISKFLDYLVENEYGFWTNTPEEFPDLSMQWDHPGKLTNAIIEYKNGYSPYTIRKVFDALEQLRCSDIQLRLFGNCDFTFIKKIIDSLYGRYFCVIDLLVPYSDKLDVDELLNLMKHEHRIIPLTIYNCTNKDLRNYIKENDKFLLSRVHITSENFHPGRIKEQVSLGTFYINTEFFTESQNFNTGLNRKLCIDIDGNLKNHILHKTVFGNIGKDKPATIIDSASFQKQWKIKNDNIEICRVCLYLYCQKQFYVKYDFLDCHQYQCIVCG